MNHQKPWFTDIKKVEFPFIYFWTDKEDEYLSVTPSSPGWLPSITLKDKTNVTSNNLSYLKKKNAIDSRQFIRKFTDL